MSLSVTKSTGHLVELGSKLRKLAFNSVVSVDLNAKRQS